MKHFTRSLYIAINKELDDADDRWDIAVENYRKELESFIPQATADIQDLAQRNFHDVEVLEESELSSSFILLLETGNLLYYTLGPVIKDDAEWPFSKERVHWLYDEVAKAEQGLGTVEPKSREIYGNS